VVRGPHRGPQRGLKTDCSAESGAKEEGVSEGSVPVNRSFRLLDRDTAELVYHE
jgi:hypothetical protein